MIDIGVVAALLIAALTFIRTEFSLLRTAHKDRLAECVVEVSELREAVKGLTVERDSLRQQVFNLMLRLNQVEKTVNGGA